MSQSELAGLNQRFWKFCTFIFTVTFTNIERQNLAAPVDLFWSFEHMKMKVKMMATRWDCCSCCQPVIAVVLTAVVCAGLNTEQMLLKDMKSVSSSLSLAVSVLYVRLEVGQQHTHTLLHTTSTQRTGTYYHTLSQNT